jgi:hypothetical protein
MPEPLSAEDRARHIGTLNESSDSAQLRSAAVALAASADRDATLALARSLRGAGFLLRLDPPVNGVPGTANTLALFAALAANPTEWSGRLCELIYPEPAFREVLSRVNGLLGALAAVVPTTPQGAAIFRAAAAEGFAEVVAPLLLRNASPAALEVFEDLIAGETVSEPVRVDMLHRALLPRRAIPAVVACCSRLLARPLPAAVRTALVETLFDYRSREWFGPAMYPPEPPPWTDAETASLEQLIAMADALPPGAASPLLQAAVGNTRQELAEILGSRRP